MKLDYEKLSPLKENILNWYPFDNTKNLLEITSNNYNLTDMLRKKCKKIITVNSCENVKFQEKFDYIVINYVEDINENLNDLMEYANYNLKKDGIIILIANNKYGLQMFNYNNKINNKNLVSKFIINKYAQQYNFSNIKYYYPLPNYKYPNVIFTDKHIPSNESILRDLTIYDEDEILAVDERKKYMEIINDDPSLFSFFANTYIVELSNKDDNGIEFVSFNNSRKSKYRMITILFNDIAKKFPINNELGHLNKIKLNIKRLNELDINLLDSVKENYIESKIIKKVKSFDKFLIEFAKNNEYKKLIDYIKIFVKELKDKIEVSENIEYTVFNKYNIDVSDDIKNKLYFVKDGFYDLIFQNTFYFDNKFYFYDQEWVEENIPFEFILYRAVNYLSNSSRFVDKNILFKELNLIEYITVFEQLEEQLQKEIVDQVIWEIHGTNHITIKNLQDTCVHYNNLKTIEENKNIELTKKVEYLVNNLENKERELEAIKNSKSWKLTKPLRKLRLFIK